MSETTDVIDSAAKAPEGNRWEIESQSLNNNNKIRFVNYLIVHIVAHSPTHLKFLSNTIPIQRALPMMEATSPSI